MNGLRTLGIVPLLLAAFLGSSLGFRFGPPPGLTGAPSDIGTCAGCHSSFPLNSGPATFALRTSDHLALAATVPVQIDFGSTSLPLHGFQITQRDGAGAPNGSWTITDPANTQLTSTHYVSHTFTGTSLLSWSVDWVPPTPPMLPPGPVTFYAAGNDADGNGAATGDFIHTAQVTVYQAGLDAPTASWAVGTTEVLDLNAPTASGHLYVLAISDSIASSTPLGGAMVVPLDLNSTLTPLGWTLPTIFQNFIGTLDSLGVAQAQVVIPNTPALIGLTMHFAYATVDPVTAAISEVSNRVTRTL